MIGFVVVVVYVRVAWSTRSRRHVSTTASMRGRGIAVTPSASRAIATSRQKFLETDCGWTQSSGTWPTASRSPFFCTLGRGVASRDDCLLAFGSGAENNGF